MAGMGQENIDEFRAALAERQVLTARHREGPRRPGGGPGRGDAGDARNPALPAQTLAQMAEGLRPGVDGWVDDDLAFVRPWGFDLAAIEVPVPVWRVEPTGGFEPPTYHLRGGCSAS
jgi:hypothetical protein